MHPIVAAILIILLLSCGSKKTASFTDNNIAPEVSITLTPRKIVDTNNWLYFLQHLPEVHAPVLDYKGVAIRNQSKHFSVINYDVGNRDLQQCADALIRLRAEYLFAQNRLDEITFQFTSGHNYSYRDYCEGKTPLPDGNSITFVTYFPRNSNQQSFRKYLDLVYAYAGTISLANELKNTSALTIGTVVISPGSPGHCFIITDEATTSSGEKWFKLVEGYTPAQSIYVLRNKAEPALGYWHRLSKGPIATASYNFKAYKLKAFE